MNQKIHHKKNHDKKIKNENKKEKTISSQSAWHWNE